MMTSAEMTRPARSLPASLAYMIESQVWLAALTWIGFTTVVMAAVVIASNATDITASAWQDAGSQAPRIYGLVIGIHVGFSLLALHVTHGQTRREFSKHAGVLIAVLSAFIALLVVLGYLIEAGVYEAAGWSQAITDRHLYDSVSDVHLILFESFLVQVLWTAGGAYLGASFYRSEGYGALAIVACILFTGVSGILFGDDWGPMGWVYEQVTGAPSVDALIGVPMYLGCIALMLAITWPVVRDIPIRSKSA